MFTDISTGKMVMDAGWLWTVTPFNTAFARRDTLPAVFPAVKIAERPALVLTLASEFDSDQE
jgi:hypothetical protein